MPELSLSNIDQINRDIRQQEISFSHLMDELIDHVCCDVEYEMKHGLDFSEAYFKVKSEIGTRGLKEIQEETLYAVDTKYRKMKNTMKISGISGTIMLGIASVLKILHFQGGGILMTLGAVLLALLFLPSSLVVLWKETHNSKRLLLFVSAFLTGAAFIIGILFKTQHWPAAWVLISLAVVFAILLFLPSLLISKLADNENVKKRPVYIIGFISMAIYLAGFWLKFQHWPMAAVFMSIGSLVLLIVVLPWYTWLTWKEENQVSTKFIFIIVTIALFVMPAALINLGFQKTYDDEFFVHLDQQLAWVSYKSNQNESLINSYKDSLQFKQMELIHSKTSETIARIEKIEAKMVQIAEGKPGRPASDPVQVTSNGGKQEISYRKLSSPFVKEPVILCLVPGNPTRAELDASLSGYKEFLSTGIPTESAKEYDELLATSSYLPSDKSVTGELAMISGLHALTIMKIGILTAESKAICLTIKH